MAILNRFIPYLIAGFVLALPWQVRYILIPSDNQYNIISLYGFDIILIILLVIWLWYWYRARLVIDWQYIILGLSAVVLVFFSGYWAANRDVAFYYWLRFALGLALIGVIATAPRRPALVPLISLALAANGLVQTSFAWVQFYMQRVVGHAWLGIATQLPETAGVAVVTTAAGRWLRAYGTMPHPNSAGAVIVIGLIACLLLRPFAAKLWQSILLLIAMALLTSGLLLTFSRSAVLIWLVCAAVGLWFYPKLRHLILTSISTLAVLGAIFVPLLLARAAPTTFTEKFSLSERAEQFQSALSLWQRNWPMGVGIGHYTLQFAPDPISQPVHFIPLLIAIETGIGATVLWYWLIARVVWQNRRRILSNPSVLFIASTLGLGLLDHYFWTLPSLFWLWCVLIGFHISCSKSLKMG